MPLPATDAIILITAFTGCDAMILGVTTIDIQAATGEGAICGILFTSPPKSMHIHCQVAIIFGGLATFQTFPLLVRCVNNVEYPPMYLSLNKGGYPRDTEECDKCSGGCSESLHKIVEGQHYKAVEAENCEPINILPFRVHTRPLVSRSI